MPPLLTIKIEEPGGEISEHGISAIWVQQMSLDEMLENQLYILLPFWLMRYEGRFEAIAHDSLLENQLLEECRGLQMRFAEALESETTLQDLGGDAGINSTFPRRMTELIIRVSDHLLRGYDPLQREVREAMGVKILKFADERHAEREQKAREEGREQERRRLARELSECGVDQSIIDKVFAFGSKDDSDDEGPSVQQA